MSTLLMRDVLRGARRLAGVSIFVLPFGFAFGAAAVAAGLSPAQATGMSAVVFAGAAQFAALDIWGDGMSLLSLVVVTLAVNGRHAIFGTALAPVVNGLPRLQRIAVLMPLSDANFADMEAARREGFDGAGILLGGGLVLWASWVTGTGLGALIGSSAGDMSLYGLDVLMAAFFMVVAVGGLRAGGRWAPVAVAAMVAVVSLSLLPGGWNMIAGTLSGGIVGIFARDQ